MKYNKNGIALCAWEGRFEFYGHVICAAIILGNPLPDKPKCVSHYRWGKLLHEQQEVVEKNGNEIVHMRKILAEDEKHVMSCLTGILRLIPDHRPSLNLADTPVCR